MSTDEDLTAGDSPEEMVRFEIRNQVAWITINNPEKGNAISPAMRDRMASILNGLNGRFEARAVVITATGRKLFCPGPTSAWGARPLSGPMVPPSRLSARHDG